MTDKEKKEKRWLKYRREMLPVQLDRARRRYIGLVREARRLGYSDLLTNREMFGEEYD